MLSGCVLSLSSIYLFGLDGQIISPAVFPNICQIKTWVLSIGFTLGYGAMYSKVWRVHRLHTSQKKNAIRVKFRPFFYGFLLYTVDRAIRFSESFATVENVFHSDIFVSRRCRHSIPLAMHGSAEARHTDFCFRKSFKQQRRYKNKTRTRAL